VTVPSEFRRHLNIKVVKFIRIQHCLASCQTVMKHLTYLCEEGAFCAQTFGPAHVRRMGSPAVGTEENTKLQVLNEFLFTFFSC
jgi:hypothetical protein